MLPRGPPQRPLHKQTHRTQEKRLTHSTAPHPVQHTYTMHCATARCVSFIHSAASLNARAARARTSEARVSHHMVAHKSVFSQVLSAFVPRLLRLLALLRFVGTRPSRYVVTTGDTRTFPSVSCVVWESACGSSLDDGYANVSAFALQGGYEGPGCSTTVAQQLTVPPSFSSTVSPSLSYYFYCFMVSIIFFTVPVF